MKTKLENCPLCDSKNFMTLEDGSLVCNNCGLGIKGKPNLANHLQNVWVIANITKAFYPNLSEKELTDKIMSVLHNIENHPSRPDGYCEFCEKIKP